MFYTTTTTTSNISRAHKLQNYFTLTCVKFHAIITQTGGIKKKLMQKDKQRAVCVVRLLGRTRVTVGVAHCSSQPGGLQLNTYYVTNKSDRLTANVVPAFQKQVKMYKRLKILF